MGRTSGVAFQGTELAWKRCGFGLLESQYSGLTGNRIASLPIWPHAWAGSIRILGFAARWDTSSIRESQPNLIRETSGSAPLGSFLTLDSMRRTTKNSITMVRRKAGTP